MFEEKTSVMYVWRWMMDGNGDDGRIDDGMMTI